jgi:cation diffusion facilitator CzcD-associated flavoprotein CzcO
MDDFGVVPGGLDALAREVARDLERLTLPPRNWPATVAGPDGTAMTDVLIIGAGMCGIAAAAALMFKGIRNIAILDRAPDGMEGPWVTTARMTTLRSPKHLPGVALGIPSLTFRAWYSARHGEAGWDALYKIANADWMDYLTWIRRTLALPQRNGISVERIVPCDGFLRVETDVGGAIFARRVVLATGRGGAGGFAIPGFVDRGLWPDLAAHTGEDIDFSRLAGKRVAVIGAGASAWDNAATALEHAAASVDMYVRRAHLPQINKGRGSAHPGFFEGWAALSAEARWNLLVYLHDLQAPPPHETVLRTIAHPGFGIHFSSHLHAAVRDEDGVVLRIGDDGRIEWADFLIVGTGFGIDLAAQPELSELAPHIALWRDMYRPPPDLRRAELGRFPFLGSAFECIERVAGDCPALARVHLINHAAFASLGPIASDIPGVSTGAERLASRIAQSFFRDDLSQMRADLEAFDEPELEPTPFFVPR